MSKHSNHDDTTNRTTTDEDLEAVTEISFARAVDDSDSEREEIAKAFGRDTDPLTEFEPTFRNLNRSGFNAFTTNELDSQNPHDDTRYQYELAFDYWSEFMNIQDRHPACPNERHVVAFIDYLLASKDEGGKELQPRTAKGMVEKLNRIYKYWQRDAGFPHPNDFNPFEMARPKRSDELSPSEGKEVRPIPIEELRAMMASVTDIRRRAIIGLQLKLGLRAGEVSNIQLGDINIASAELARHYSELGTNPKVADYENAIYIPPCKERPGNKSVRARILPLDDETRQLLLRYLLVRPDAGEPWVFLSKKTHSEINKKVVNKEWKEAFHPEYAETEEYESVTSHFGRHRFTTFWKIEQDVNRQLVQYMRGDIIGEGSVNYRDAIDAYLHAYYEDIEGLYRENIYKLQL